MVLCNHTFFILVTCQRQPALGGVYKLVEINLKPKIKLSQDVEKVTMPGKKTVHRLYSSDGHALIDLLQRPDELPPQVGKRVLCRHPFHVSKPNWKWVCIKVHFPLCLCNWGRRRKKWCRAATSLEFRGKEVLTNKKLSLNNGFRI